MSELHTKKTKVLKYISVCIDNIESTVPSAVVVDEAAQLRMDVKVFIEGRNVLSNETDLRIFRVNKL